jgi:F-type H+-transporting ATPase subunit delta
MPQAIASRYAQALADAVMAPQSGVSPEEALGQLRTFEDVVRSSPDLRTVLESPAVSGSKKRAAIARLAESTSLSRLVRNFLFVLIDRRRSSLLDEVADSFEAEIDERRGLVRARVTSASPMDQAEREQIQNALSAAEGKTVRCTFDVDPQLIGGLVARIGSKVYDGSVRSQLNTMRQRLAAAY